MKCDVIDGEEQKRAAITGGIRTVLKYVIIITVVIIMRAGGDPLEGH